MVVPMQIKFVESEPVTLTAATVPYMVSVQGSLEFAFLITEDDGDVVALSPYEFACRSAACAPHNGGGSLPKGAGGGAGGGGAAEGGTGAKPKRVKMTPEEKKAKADAKKIADKEAKEKLDHENATTASGTRTVDGAPAMYGGALAAIFPGMRDTHKKVNPDGTFSIEGLDEKGERVAFSAAAEAKIKAQWDGLGPSEQDYVDSMVMAGKLATGIDLKTSKTVDLELQAQGLENSKWYYTANADAKGITAETTIPVENVVAATTVMSAGRKWSGTASGNKETALALARLVHKPIDIEVNQAALDLMDWKREKATKGPGQIGLHNTIPPLTRKLKPGETISSNDLDSATLAEVLYATNAVRGHSSFKSWADGTKDKDGKIGMQTSKEQKDFDKANDGNSIYPYFSPMGTGQVKQAIAILRQEVTPRQAITGPKYSSFYSNILRPDVNYSTTNDVWQYRIQAGDLPLTHKTTKPQRAKLGVDTVTATIKELTVGKGALNSAQGLLQTGAGSAPDHLSSGDGMFRDSSVIMDRSRKQLQVEHPEVFKDMSRHEFQALVWVHFGGGTTVGESTSRWDSGVAAMKEARGS